MNMHNSIGRTDAPPPIKKGVRLKNPESYWFRKYRWIQIILQDGCTRQKVARWWNANHQGGVDGIWNSVILSDAKTQRQDLFQTILQNIPHSKNAERMSLCKASGPNRSENLNS